MLSGPVFVNVITKLVTVNANDSNATCMPI